MTRRVWEIMVPTHYQDGTYITLDTHQVWDQNICNIAGGLTLQPTVNGRWVPTIGAGRDLVAESVIPVRIACTDEQIDSVLAFTCSYYDQEEVMAWVVSEEVRSYRPEYNNT